MLRVDYNVSSKIQTFVKLLQDYQAVNGYGGTVKPWAEPGGNSRPAITCRRRAP